VAKHNGLRSKILKVLEQNKEMYAHEIAEAVGSTSRKVSNALFAMDDVYRIKQHGTRNAKCIYSLKPIEGMIEEVIKPVKKDKPKRYVPEFKPMAEHSYDIYAGRNLAMLAR
jgi:DNA-binding transcriptional ArsR family regulator